MVRLPFIHLAITLAFATSQSDPYINSDTVDYVIVGGGPAGFVLAEQLSRDPQISVVLLEAGPDGTDAPTINIPAYAPLNTEPVSDVYVWNFTGQPDPNLSGLRAALAQGHAFGGGSAVNYMAYCRGAPSVFDEWASISGDEELRWDALLIDFKATAHYTPAPSDYKQVINASTYGNGPLEVSHTSSLDGFDPHYRNALEAGLDLPQVDLNGGIGLGVTQGMTTIRVSNRTRDYALEAFGWQMARRPNVQMMHSAWVSQIGFEGKCAKNVTYLSLLNNEMHTINAKEVLVSSGAIGSPKLLMLSGIGPKTHLDELGIPLVLDVPDVGSNLYDHHFSVIEVEVTPDVKSVWRWSENATGAALAQEEYKANHTGPLSYSDGTSWAVARVPNSVFEAVNDTFHPSLPADRGQLLYQASTAAFVSGSPNKSIVSSFVALVQPEASGHLRLNSSDFRDDPVIYTNYYGSEGDKAAMLYGYKKLREIVHSSPMAPVVVREVFPGPNVTTDEGLWHAIQKSAQTFHHPIGTVALGKVVDKNWRVKGLEGIRVVDSSTFPYSPTCHIQADVYAYAHRAARAIKKEDIPRMRRRHSAGEEHKTA